MRKSDNSSITPASMEETFTYDNLDRLDTAVLKVNGGAGVTVMDLAYDAAGNITQKIDTTGTKNYSYHATKKHAVTSAGGTSYTYDANGNMATRGGVTQGWNAANLPSSLSNGTYAASFSYGPGRARYKQVATYSGRTETTTYVGSLYERFTKTGSTDTEHRYLVTAGGLPVAKVTDLQPASGSVTRTTTYLHRDHLGSVDTVTSETGTVLARMSFDAHGNRRAAMTSQGSAWRARLTYAGNTATVDGLRAQHTRGYTDHEMLDNVGLIHMNGRVYDPAIGRFLSVDPVFQFPENTQSLNPYSYVLNSPLSHTDPTGFCTDEDKSACDSASGRRERQSERNEKRGGSTTRMGRTDTTSQERRAGVKHNGTQLSDSDRGEWAATSRLGDDASTIGSVSKRIADAPGSTPETAGSEYEAEFLRMLEDPSTWGELLQYADTGGTVMLDRRNQAFLDGDISEDEFRQQNAETGIAAAAGAGAVLGVVVAAEVVGAGVLLAGAKAAIRPKPGSAGGPGAGKDFSKKVADAARKESGDKCVFCAVRTTRSSQPSPTRSNVDHAVPKSRGGNNTLENAQNTCQTCNLEKRARTTEEYLRDR